MSKNCSLTAWNQGNCTIDMAALLPDGVSFRVPAGSVVTTPDHGGNFLLSVFRTDMPTAPVVQYGSGTYLDPSLGHYPAGADSTYPLFPLTAGDYFVVVQTNDGIFNCGCLDVPEWDICTNSVQMNYEGETNVPAFEYDLPINSSMTEIQFQFLTQTIPDQIEILYNGSVIYDSGLISTGGTEISGTIDASGVNMNVGGFPPVVSNPFVYVSGVDTIQIRLSPDPSQPPNTTTIFGASIGCCDVNQSIEKPFRDPYFTRILNASCGFQVRHAPPYVNEADGGFYRNSGTYNGRRAFEWMPNLDNVGSGCLFSDSSIVFPRFIYGRVCGRPVRSWGCTDYGLASNRTITNNGDGTLTITYSDTASYNLAKAWYQALEARIITAFGSTSDPAYFIQRLGGKAVLCAADGPNIGPIGNRLYHPSITSFDDGLEEITHDFNAIAEAVVEGTGCCPDTEISPSQALVYADAWANGIYSANMASTTSVLMRRPINLFQNDGGISPDSIDSQGRVIYRWTYGINFAQGFTHSNPPQIYSTRVDEANDLFELWRGEVDTGVLLQSLSSDLTDPATQFAGSLESDVHYAARSNGSRNVFTNTSTTGSFIAVHNEDGCPLQTADMVGKSLDLSYYGGARDEVFASAQELLDRMNELPGMADRFELYPHNTELMIVTRVDPAADYRPITCTV